MGTMARAGLVLAAGASRRYGGEPKALLRIGPETAVARIVRLLDLAGTDPIVVVVGAHASEIRTGAGIGPTGRVVRWIDHPDWARGRTGSIQAGLPLIPPDADLVLWPVDHALVAPGTLPLLLRASEADPTGRWFVPEYRGRGGHPVLLRPPAWSAIPTLAPDRSLRELLGRVAPPPRRIGVEDPGVVVNLNTPAEYLEARRAGLPIGEERWTGT